MTKYEGEKNSSRSVFSKVTDENIGASLCPTLASDCFCAALYVGWDVKHCFLLTYVCRRCVRYDKGWTNDGCQVVNNLLLGVDRHVDCACQHVAAGYAVLVETPRPPSTVGYTIWFHVSCFICIVSFTFCFQ